VLIAILSLWLTKSESYEKYPFIILNLIYFFIYNYKDLMEIEEEQEGIFN
jgi:hypothetical protein